MFNTLTVFPLSLLRDAREFARAGRYNSDLHYGWNGSPSIRYGVAVTCQRTTNVFCGVEAAFRANVFVDGGSRFSAGSAVYIGVDGSHNIPA